MKSIAVSAVMKAFFVRIFRFTLRKLGQDEQRKVSSQHNESSAITTLALAISTGDEKKKIRSGHIYFNVNITLKVGTQHLFQEQKAYYLL